MIRKPNSMMHAELSGHFKLQVFRPDGSMRQEVEFDNLITDTGLEQYGLQNGADILPLCVVGTGSATPAFSDTTLGTQLAHSDNITAQSLFNEVSAGYVRIRRTFRFAAGVATGNLTEVGIRSDNSSGSLFSRALILDGSNAPTTITILSDEVLDVTYELRIYKPAADVTGTVTLGGTNYAFTIRPANSTASDWASPQLSATAYRFATYPSAYSSGIAAENTSPSGTLGNGDVPVAQTYVNGSKQRDFLISFGLSAVTANIGSLLFNSNFGIYQIGFAPVVPKTNANVLSLTVRLSWARKTS